MHDGITSIGDSAFCSTALTSIKIPDSVTNIGYNAFSSCNELISVKIPDGVTNIRGETFENCKKLRRVIIPASVTKIYNNAFDYSDNVTIYGTENSSAQSFAEDYGIPFVSIIPGILGDANNDELVDVRDITCIQRHIAEFELITNKRTYLADFDCDGEVTVANATLLQMYLAEYDVQIS